MKLRWNGTGLMKTTERQEDIKRALQVQAPPKNPTDITKEAEDPQENLEKRSELGLAPQLTEKNRRRKPLNHHQSPKSHQRFLRKKVIRQNKKRKNKKRINRVRITTSGMEMEKRDLNSSAIQVYIIPKL